MVKLVNGRGKQGSNSYTVHRLNTPRLGWCQFCFLVVTQALLLALASPFKMSTEESYLQVLRLLQTNPRVNQRGLAEALGISLGKTNYCLKALLNKGLIKVQNFRSSDNKLAYTYLLTPAGIAEKANLTARFLKRKVSEYEALNQEIEQLRQELESSQASLPEVLQPVAPPGVRS